MHWPIFYADVLKSGNPASHVGICTLWTEQEKIVNSIDKSKYCVAGNLYSSYGVNAMIKNIFANPKIRYVILCGADLSGSGNALIRVMSGDMEGIRIDSNITPELLEKFRTNVKVVDMRGKEPGIEKIIDGLPRLGAFCEPMELPAVQESFPTLSSSKSGFVITVNSIADGWLRLLDTIMKFGEEKPSEYGVKQKEILDLVMVIEGDDDGIAPWFSFTKTDLEKYYPTVLDGTKNPNVHYTYGERLFSHPMIGRQDGVMKIDQVELAFEHIKKVPHTRRAIAFTWNVELDSMSQHPPCITQVSWNIKNGKLCQTATIRSNDMFNAWPMNAFALRELQRRMAKRLGVEMGQTIIISNSAHLYENTWSGAAKVLEKYFTGESEQFAEDPLGYFIVSIQNGEIVLQHCLPTGGPSQYVFRGKSAIDVYRAAVHENLFSKFDHAAYVGKELARAEEALKKGQPFVQDKA